jgi:hypothetical protein
VIKPGEEPGKLFLAAGKAALEIGMAHGSIGHGCTSGG